jgi:uncharacterized protein (TIGR00266 family)
MQCPVCNGEIRYVDQYKQYYCDRCQAWRQPAGTGGAPPSTEARAAFPFSVEGKWIQMVVATLGAGQALRVQPGVMLYRDPSVQMQTKAQGGLMKGLGRAMLGGESLMLTDYGGPGRICISAGVPGEIMPLTLGGAAVRAKSGAFIACETNVEMEVTTEKIGTAIIGGTGLFQLRFHGAGTVFIQAKGDIIKGTLAAGQELITDENSFLAVDDSVTRTRERVQGMRNILTGGEGLYLLKLTGPGRYWLESGGGLIDWIRQLAAR